MSIAEKLRQAYHNDLTDCPILLDGAEELDKKDSEIERLTQALEAMLRVFDRGPDQQLPVVIFLARAAIAATAQDEDLP